MLKWAQPTLWYWNSHKEKPPEPVCKQAIDGAQVISPIYIYTYIYIYKLVVLWFWLPWWSHQTDLDMSDVPSWAWGIPRMVSMGDWWHFNLANFPLKFRGAGSHPCCEFHRVLSTAVDHGSPCSSLDVSSGKGSRCSLLITKTSYYVYLSWQVMSSPSHNPLKDGFTVPLRVLDLVYSWFIHRSRRADVAALQFCSANPLKHLGFHHPGRLGVT